MRLLHRSDTSDFGLTQFSNDAIPPYAILSHTWGADDEEVTFDDLTNGTGKDKPGYKKIWFCREQAAQDGLEYFWIDTCCINKANKVELSQSINSMFHWYQNALECYVYLSDVSTAKRKADNEFIECTWEQTFRESRWFTRGWTLQELLAPTSVEFFSREWKKLGDKQSLRQRIHEITGIPNARLIEPVYLSSATKSDFRGYNAARQRLKKTKHTHYLVFSTSKCLFAMEKELRVHLND